MAKRPIKITTAYEIVTQESAEEGDAAERGWEDEDGKKVGSVSEAVRFLKDEGVIEPSSSCFHKGVWYNDESQQDMQTGAYKQRSFFIKNATQKQQELIYKKLFPRYKKCR